MLIRRLITEANLLLDFEVARRLVDGDRYFGLPIVTYLPFLIKNLEICNDFIAGKKSSDWGGSKDDTVQSLFTGVERSEIVARELTRKIGFQSPQAIRDEMNCLCQNDELSGCEYEYKETDQESDVEGFNDLSGSDIINEYEEESGDGFDPLAPDTEGHHEDIRDGKSLFELVEEFGSLKIPLNSD